MISGRVPSSVMTFVTPLSQVLIGDGLRDLGSEEATQLVSRHQAVGGTVVPDERWRVDRREQLGEHGPNGEIPLRAIDRARGLLLRDQDLVDLFARTNAGDDGVDRA